MQLADEAVAENLKIVFTFAESAIEKCRQNAEFLRLLSAFMFKVYNLFQILSANI